MEEVERRMDVFQNQVDSLNVKVDALHQTVEQFKVQMVEQLNDQTAEILSGIKSATDDRSNLLQPGASAERYPYYNRASFSSELEHKDVLSDHGYSESEYQSGERSLAPEIQVQRLTAQLTAAYNRIAALEEQLLSKRVH